MKFLEEKDCWEATREILANPQMVQEIKEADRAWKENRMEEFIPWDKVKKKVPPHLNPLPCGERK